MQSLIGLGLLIVIAGGLVLGVAALAETFGLAAVVVGAGAYLAFTVIYIAWLIRHTSPIERNTHEQADPAPRHARRP